MQKREKLAAALIYLSGAAWVATGAIAGWLLLSGAFYRSILAFPAMIVSTAALTLASLSAGFVILYAGAQVAYSVPGWLGESRALLAGAALSGAVFAAEVSMLAGATIIAAAAAAAMIVAPGNRASRVKTDARRAIVLALVAAFPGAAISSVSFASADLETSWSRLQPAPLSSVREAVSPLLTGTYDYFHMSPGPDHIPGTWGVTAADVLVEQDRSSSRSIGTVDLSSCEGWGSQSHSRLRGGSLRLLSSAGPSVEDYDFWAQSGSVRLRAPAGESSFRISSPSSMLPYVPSLRDSALSGTGPEPVGICSALSNLELIAESIVEESPGTYRIRISGEAAERAARIGEVARESRRLEALGASRLLAAMLLVTNPDLPDLGRVTSIQRSVLLESREGRLYKVTVFAETPDGDLLLDTIWILEPSITKPSLPDPEGFEWQGTALTKLISPIGPFARPGRAP